MYFIKFSNCLKYGKRGKIYFSLVCISTRLNSNKPLKCLTLTNMCNTEVNQSAIDFTRFIYVSHSSQGLNTNRSVHILRMTNLPDTAPLQREPLNISIASPVRVPDCISA
mgnify:CR=1 FL=1